MLKKKYIYIYIKERRERWEIEKRGGKRREREGGRVGMKQLENGDRRNMMMMLGEPKPKFTPTLGFYTIYVKELGLLQL